MAEVTVAEDVLTAQGEPWHGEHGTLEGWESDPGFFISAADGEHRALLPAIWPAIIRFSHIDENGSELDDWELNGETYTPNYVSEPVVHPSGISLWADTKGFLSVPMGEAMVRVLTEELSSRGLAAHIAASSEGFDANAGQSAPFEEYAAADPGEPTEPKHATEPVERFWYMARTVWTTTTTGRRYQDVEYRRTDGAWGRNRSSAQRWPEDETDTMVALAHELRAQESAEYHVTYGEATGLLLPADPTVDPWPMPPSHLRAGDPSS